MLISFHFLHKIDSDASLLLPDLDIFDKSELTYHINYPHLQKELENRKSTKSLHSFISFILCQALMKLTSLTRFLWLSDL